MNIIIIFFLITVRNKKYQVRITDFDQSYPRAFAPTQLMLLS